MGRRQKWQEAGDRLNNLARSSEVASGGSDICDGCVYPANPNNGGER